MIAQENGSLELREEVLDLRRKLAVLEEKYGNALKSIKEILQANRQIKTKLDHMKMNHSIGQQAQNEEVNEFLKRAYENVLKEKSKLSMRLQNSDFEVVNSRVKLAEMDHQLSLIRGQAERERKGYKDPRESQPSSDIVQMETKISALQDKCLSLNKAKKTLQEQIEEKNLQIHAIKDDYKTELEKRDLEDIDIRAQIRKELQAQILLLRKENNALKIFNSELEARAEAERMYQRGSAEDQQQHLIADLKLVRESIGPLKAQVAELHQISAREQTADVKGRTMLEIRVLELEADCQRLEEMRRNLQNKVLEAKEGQRLAEQYRLTILRLQEENSMLHSKVIVLESKEVAVRNRRGDGLEERVLEFEARITTLMRNKENFKELKEVGVNQLIDLKAFIFELEDKLKTMSESHDYAAKKYKSYKEKCIAMTQDIRTQGTQISELNNKITRYDHLVNKLKSELQRALRANDMVLVSHNTRFTQEQQKTQMNVKKIEVLKEKLEQQQKKMQQQLDTVKLRYEARIAELTTSLEELHQLKGNLQAYKEKNDDLAGQVAAQSIELGHKRFGSSMIMSGVHESGHNTKEIIAGLHKKVQEYEQSIRQLRTDLKSKDEEFRRKAEANSNQLQTLTVEIAKLKLKQNDSPQVQLKKLRNKISQLQTELSDQKQTHSQEHQRKIQEMNQKISRLDTQLKESQAQYDKQVICRRKVERECSEMVSEREGLRIDLDNSNRKLTSLQKEAVGLKQRLSEAENQIMHFQTEFSKKDFQLRRLNTEINQYRPTINNDREIYSLRNQIKEKQQTIQQLNQKLRRKGIQFNNFNTHNLNNQLEEKETVIHELNQKLRKKGLQIFNLTQKYQSNKSYQHQQIVHNLTEKIRQKDQQILSLKRQTDTNNLLNINKKSNDGEQLLRLQQIIYEKEEVINKLAYQKRRIQQVMRLKNVQNNSIEQQKIGQNEKIKWFERQMLELRQTIFQQQITISTLRNEVYSLQHYRDTSKITSQSQIANDNNLQLSQLVMQISQFKKTLFEQESVLSQLGNELEWKKEEANRTRRECTQWKERTEEIEQRFRLKQIELQRINSQKRIVEQTIFELQMQMQGQKQRRSRAAQDALNKQETINNLNEQLQRLKISQKNSIPRHEHQAQIDMRQAEIRKLVFESKSFTRAIETASEQLSQRQNQLTRLQREHKCLKQQHYDATVQLQQRKERVLSLEQELNGMKSEWSRLQAEREAQGKENYERISKMRVEQSNLRMQVELQAEEASMRQVNLNRSKAQLTRLREEWAAQQDELDQAKEQLSKYRIEIEVNRSEIASAEQEYHSNNLRITQELNREREQRQSLQEEIEEREAQIHRMSLQINSMQSNTLAINEEIGQKDLQISRGKSQVSQLRGEIQRNHQEIREKIQIVNKLRQQILALKLETSEKSYSDEMHWNQEIFKLKGVIEELRDEIVDKDNTISRINAEFSIARATNIEAQNEQINNLQQLLVKAQAECNKIRYELSTQKNELEQANALVASEKRKAYSQKLEFDLEIDKLQRQCQIARQKERALENQIRNLKEMAAQKESVLMFSKPSFNQESTQLQFYKTQWQQCKAELKKCYNKLEQDAAIRQKLDKQLSMMKLKLTSTKHQQDRIEEYLAIITILFAEIEALRGRIHNNEEKTNSIRKSCTQIIDKNKQHTMEADVFENREFKEVESYYGSASKIQQQQYKKKKQILGHLTPMSAQLQLHSEEEANYSIPSPKSPIPLPPSVSQNNYDQYAFQKNQSKSKQQLIRNSYGQTNYQQQGHKIFEKKNFNVANIQIANIQNQRTKEVQKQSPTSLEVAQNQSVIPEHQKNIIKQQIIQQIISSERIENVQNQQHQNKPQRSQQINNMNVLKFEEVQQKQIIFIDNKANQKRKLQANQADLNIKKIEYWPQRQRSDRNIPKITFVTSPSNSRPIIPSVSNTGNGIYRQQNQIFVPYGAGLNPQTVIQAHNNPIVYNINNDNINNNTIRSSLIINNNVRTSRTEQSLNVFYSNSQRQTPRQNQRVSFQGSNPQTTIFNSGFNQNILYPQNVSTIQSRNVISSNQRIENINQIRQPSQTIFVNEASPQIQISEFSRLSNYQPISNEKITNQQHRIQRPQMQITGRGQERLRNSYQVQQQANIQRSKSYIQTNRSYLNSQDDIINFIDGSFRSPNYPIPQTYSNRPNQPINNHQSVYKNIYNLQQSQPNSTQFSNASYSSLQQGNLSQSVHMQSNQRIFLNNNNQRESTNNQQQLQRNALNTVLQQQNPSYLPNTFGASNQHREEYSPQTPIFSLSHFDSTQKLFKQMSPKHNL